MLWTRICTLVEKDNLLKLANRSVQLRKKIKNRILAKIEKNLLKTNIKQELFKNDRPIKN